MSGDPSLNDLTWSARAWSGSSAYADSKLHDVILAFAVARKWPDVLSNALEPGWVPTKMGGPGAPDDLEAGPKTQVWLATSKDPDAMVTGQYFYHQKRRAAEAPANMVRRRRTKSGDFHIAYYVQGNGPIDVMLCGDAGLAPLRRSRWTTRISHLEANATLAQSYRPTEILGPGRR